MTVSFGGLSVTKRLLTTLVLATAAAAWIGVGGAAAATVQVDTTSDGIDADPGDGTCGTAAGTCTLRAAMMEAEKHTGEQVTVVVPAGRFTLERPAALEAMSPVDPVQID